MYIVQVSTQFVYIPPISDTTTPYTASLYQFPQFFPSSHTNFDHVFSKLSSSFSMFTLVFIEWISTFHAFHNFIPFSIKVLASFCQLLPISVIAHQFAFIFNQVFASFSEFTNIAHPVPVSSHFYLYTSCTFLLLHHFLLAAGQYRSVFTIFFSVSI